MNQISTLNELGLGGQPEWPLHDAITRAESFLELQETLTALEATGIREIPPAVASLIKNELEALLKARPTNVNRFRAHWSTYMNMQQIAQLNTFIEHLPRNT
jgi:hypothetical protein